MFHQVPVLPVVVPVAAVVVVILLWTLRRRELLTGRRAAVALAVGVYVAGVLANTVFPIFLDKPPADQPWDTYLNLVPLAGYEVRDAVINIAVFVPLGILVPLFLHRARWWTVLGLGAGFSLLIEVVQYVTAHLLGGGHVADVNDLLFNVLGAALGLALLGAAARRPRARSTIDEFRWR